MTDYKGDWQLLMGDELADVGVTIRIGAGGAAERLEEDRAVAGRYAIEAGAIRLDFDWRDDEGSHVESITARSDRDDRLSATVNSRHDLGDGEPFEFCDPAVLERVRSG